MARIIGGSMIGELSGKLGGNVFARNKGGAYIRQYVVPVDPKTIAQINARSNFGFASSSYHSLNDLQKAEWDNFARNFYLPKNGANTGQFSGFNAFTALANVVTNAQNSLAFGTYADITTFNNLPGQTLKNFVISQTPPNQQIQANLASSFGPPVSITVSNNARIDILGNIFIPLYWNSTTSPTSTDVSIPFVDGAGHKIGFSVYMSNPVQQAHMHISNPEQYQIMSIGPLETTTAGDPITEGIVLRGTLPDAENYKAWPQLGNFVRLTVYAVSENGQMIRVGAVTHEVVPSVI